MSAGLPMRSIALSASSRIVEDGSIACDTLRGTSRCPGKRDLATDGMGRTFHLPCPVCSTRDYNGERRVIVERCDAPHCTGRLQILVDVAGARVAKPCPYCAARAQWLRAMESRAAEGLALVFRCGICGAELADRSQAHCVACTTLVDSFVGAKRAETPEPATGGGGMPAGRCIACGAAVGPRRKRCDPCRVVANRAAFRAWYHRKRAAGSGRGGSDE